MRCEYLADRNYDESENVRKYGQKEPPAIDFTKIHSVPIAILGGKYDLFSPVEDSEWVKDQVKPVFFKIYDTHGHITFQIGKDMSYLDDVKQLIEEYSVK